MESILDLAKKEPMELTYLGIGSSPHLLANQTLDAKYDQLIPLCFHEFLVKDKKPMRIVHFDPDFANCVEFLHAYFEKWNLLPLDCSYGLRWIGQHMDVIVVSEMIHHDEHFWFFQNLSETILQRKGKLVIQEYTGYELKTLNEKLYEGAQNKELYKRRVLLDMTYGTDTGCCTDMTKAQPFYDYDLNFLNLHFLTDEEAYRWIHVSLKLDEILKQKYVTKYLQTLNNVHVDYRRRLKGESCMFGNPLYSDESSPEEIMRVLQEALQISIRMLRKIQYLDEEAEKTFKSLCLTYKGADPYKWYDSMRKVIPWP